MISLDAVASREVQKVRRRSCARLIKVLDFGVSKALVQTDSDRGSLTNTAVLPDFIANAGGVSCAAVEYHGSSQAAAPAEITAKIRDSRHAVLAQVNAQTLPRMAALRIAEERVHAAMAFRCVG